MRSNFSGCRKKPQKDFRRSRFMLNWPKSLTNDFAKAYIFVQFEVVGLQIY